MGDDIILARPGGPDINKQFEAGNKIRKTRRTYDRMKDRTTGKYNFGELTAFFYGYDEDQDDAWQDDIRNNYPPEIIVQIRDYVITVLENVDPNNLQPPQSLTFKWDPNGPARVELTQAGDAYTITIYALMAPSSTSVVERQKTKS